METQKSQLAVFAFESAALRTIDRDGEPWFVAKDVCSILEISNNRDAITRLDEDEKGVANTDTLGGKQELAVVNESGLYSLIFTSRKPQAQAFRKWVTSEVLPAIRKTGSYSAPVAPTPQIPTFDFWENVDKMMTMGATATSAVTAASRLIELGVTQSIRTKQLAKQPKEPKVKPIADYKAEMEKVFDGVTGPIRYKDLHKAIIDKLEYRKATADRRISRWTESGYIIRTAEGYLKA